MGFWSGYWGSLKPLAVEEPIDVWVHRPLAYVLAKVLYPTPVSPNFVTFCSMLFGGFTAFAFLVDFPHHMQLGALSLFMSAVLDCTDGQLARMRKSSSAFGRMLDGVADLVVLSVAVFGVGVHVVMPFRESPWLAACVGVGVVVTAVTGSFHTASYDHYKNLYLRLTTSSLTEAEDYETARARFDERRKEEFGILARLAWPLYLFYVKNQEAVVLRGDPYTQVKFSRLPPHDPEIAALYDRHAGPVMRLWRSAFGVGSLVFGVALFAAFDALIVYVGLRLFVQNAFFYGYVRPAQRRASKAAFDAMGLRLAPVGNLR